MTPVPGEATTMNVVTRNSGLIASAGRRLEGRHELEVVAVRVLQRRDPRVGEPVHLEGVGLPDDDRPGRLETVEVPLDVGRRDVPDQPARGGVLAVDLGMRPDRDETGTD